MKRTVSMTETSCDICGNEGPVTQVLFRHTAAYDVGGSAIGIDIIAKPFGSMRNDSCSGCNYEALLAASKTLGEWDHLNRAKQLLYDFVDWYDNGARERKDLDNIYDLASDLLGAHR